MKNTAARKLKQAPMGYLVIGEDPHKKKHAAVVCFILVKEKISQSSFSADIN